MLTASIIRVTRALAWQGLDIGGTCAPTLSSDGACKKLRMQRATVQRIYQLNKICQLNGMHIKCQ